MVRFLIRRIIQAIIVMALVTIVVYVLFYVGSPENVARRLAGRQATPETVQLVYHNLGLDRPFYQQFGSFVWHLLHGDLGHDYYNGVPVTSVLKQAAPITISLAVGAAIIWLIIGVSLGVYSSIRARTLTDRSLTALALFFFSVPVFVLGLGLIYLFFTVLHQHGITWFYAAGYVGITSDPYEWFRHLLLPWFALALISAAVYLRLTRSSMLEVLGEDYIRTARSKGLRERRVIFRHGLRAAMTPIVTQFGIDLAVVLGGAILTETVFSLPGLGWEAVSAINNQDLPLIVGIVIIASAAVVVMNIIVDLLYAVLDPRVRLH